MDGAVDLGARDERGFFGAGRGQHQPSGDARRVQGQRHGQRAAHRAQGAREREFARKLVVGQAGAVNLPAGGQNAQGNGQVESARVFGQIGRGQIDGDALVVREFQAAVLDGAAHPLACLFHLHIGQAYQRKAGQAVGHVHFNGDLQGIEPQQDAALNQRQTHGRTP